MTQGCVFHPGYDKATIVITEITFGMMKDIIKSLELWWKVEFQTKTDAGMTSRKRQTEEFKKKSVNENFKMQRKGDSNSFTEHFPSEVPSNNA